MIYQRILLNIYQSNLDFDFNSLLNINLIKDNIAKYKGRVLTAYENDNFPLQEVDFLDLGCKK